MPPKRRKQDTEAFFVEYKKTGDKKIRERLIVMHLDLAHYLARKFAHRGEPLDDLIQVARIGLINAIDNFEPKYGTKFITYATPCIMGEIKRHFRDKGWTLKVPRRLKELWLTMNEAVDSLAQELNRSPTIPEIAKTMGISVEEVIELMGSRELLSLNSEKPSPNGAHTVTLSDSMINSGELMGEVTLREDIRRALKKLKDIERYVLTLRFFRELSLKEIAEQIGVSHTQVLRIQKQAIKKLRQIMQEQSDQED